MNDNNFGITAYDRVQIRIFPFYRADTGRIYILGSKEGFITPAKRTIHPNRSVEQYLMDIGISKNDIGTIHSTSWTYNKDTERITLDYSVFLSTLPSLKGKKTTPNLLPSILQQEPDQAQLQALRHMAFLEKNDEAIANALKGDWQNALSKYPPSVFTGRTAKPRRKNAPLNNILVETLPFFLKDGRIGMIAGKDGTFMEVLPPHSTPEECVLENAKIVEKVDKIIPTSWREDKEGNLILTFAAFLNHEPKLESEDHVITIPSLAIAKGSALHPPASISPEEVGSHALRSAATLKSGLSHAWKTALRPYAELPKTIGNTK